MLKLNPFRRNRNLGVDLGSHSLKWALVDPLKREVVQTGVQPLWSDRVEPENWEKRVAQALHKLPREGVSLRTVMQGRSTVCGYLELPELPDHELRVAVQAEAQRWIPFPPEATQFSHTRVPAISDNQRAGVFFAAARSAQVDRLRRLLTGSGLTPESLELPALALAREFQLNHRPTAGKFYGLIHMGFQLTQLVLVRDGFPYFARDFAPGARHFLQSLQAAYGCAWNETEELLARMDFEHWSVRPPFSRLLLGLQRSQLFAGAEIGHWYLSGGIALGSLAAALSQGLGGEVWLDDWREIRCQRAPAGLYKLAVGLALA